MQRLVTCLLGGKLRALLSICPTKVLVKANLHLMHVACGIERGIIITFHDMYRGISDSLDTTSDIAITHSK
jgi:hypothetical protein